jgi:hypothetical protein
LPQITLNLDPAAVREVIRALETRAEYLRAYRSDGTTAKMLMDVAEQFSAPASEPEGTVTKKPAGRETASAKSRRSA